jgi:UDP-N-acetylmuramate dehydrogenase
MINIRQDISLSELNTFGIKAMASNYVEIHDSTQFTELITDPIYLSNNHLVLGGGSNILLTKDFEGLVIRNCISGIDTIKENNSHVWLQVGAGVLWHDFVMHCVDQKWGGIENLSLIPGTVGAAPMQNIGAYGVEVKDVFISLEAIHKTTGILQSFDKATCEFGYRESIFKNKVKDKFIITSVTFRLTKHKHELNTSYGAIQETLDASDIGNPTIKDVSHAVIKIRKIKLPDPKEIGNAGSFFKNPSVYKINYESLQIDFPKIPGYNLPNEMVKIPAGWLIEQCGWKGKTIGNIGVHKNQALVLVNYGDGNGNDLKKLALEIQQSVVDKFGIKLNPEVNFVPS